MTDSSETPVPFHQTTCSEIHEDSTLLGCQNIGSCSIQKWIPGQIITNGYQFVKGFPTAVVMNSSVFWDILQGQRKSQTRNWHN
jgi:acyl CoA:acetate/3-ketoacid CoA transferase beta subunit